MSETADPSAIQIHLAQAHHAWQNQQIDQALDQLEALRADFPDHPEILHFLGVVYYSQGNAQAAEPLLAQACQICPDYDDYFFNWGNACLALQDWATALQAFARAYQLNPQLAEARFKQGQMLEKLSRDTEAQIIWYELLAQEHIPAVGLALARNLARSQNYQAAEKHYDRLIEIPNNAPALASQLWNEKGLLCLSQQAPERALIAFESAIQLTPQVGYLYAHKALALFHSQNFLQALEASQQAIRLQPHSAESWVNQTQILLELNRGQEAKAAFQTAIQQAPQFSQLLSSLIADELSASRDENAILMLALAEELEKNHLQKAVFNFTGGMAAQRSNLSEKAQNLYQKAIRQAPDNFVYQLAQASQLPVIYQSEAEIFEVRSQLIERLNQLQNRLQDNPRAFVLPETLEQVPLLFHLAYQGFNDIEIHTQVARMWRSIMKREGFLLPPVSTNRQTGPLKIGFVSAYLYGHSVSYCYQGLIEACGQDSEFEAYCFYLGTQEDQMTARLRQFVQSFEVLGHLHSHLKMATEIAKHELDILVYLDIGMEPLSYLLGQQRLASQQYVLAGHPITTGLPEMDWFVSTQSSEPPEAQRHYSEKLILLKSPLSSDYRLPEFPRERPKRTTLGLKDNCHIYLCPMTLYKIHPAFDPILSEILAEDPLAEIYFFQFQQQQLHLFLQARFAQNMSLEAQKRVHFLPWVSRDTFLHMLTLADICLDPFHFSAGNTTYLSLKAEIPLVTWPSQLKRGRVAFALYQRMGVHHCIAETPEVYVQKAVALASDTDYKSQVIADLAQKREQVVGHAQGVAELMAHFHLNARL